MKKSIEPFKPILIVDDQEMMLKSLKVFLRSNGLRNTILCSDSRQVEGLVRDHDPCIVLMDLMMPYRSGEELLQILAAEYPHIPVIIITGKGDVPTAVRCMRHNAYDYFVKPVDEKRLVLTIRRLVEMLEVKREMAAFRETVMSGNLNHPEHFQEMVTRNREMMMIFHYIESIAGTRQPVLITGETGVGKELTARAIHRASGLKGEFVTVSIAGLDDTMFSDTLFGHRTGAFTGAVDKRIGLVETAAGGTLFLDEIGDLGAESQVKLLRLIQERDYLPLGSDTRKHSHARIVAATNRDIASMTREGTFRKDLFYRLGTHLIHIPPLRKRLEDLPGLLDHFLERISTELGKKKPAYHPELISLLSSYHFPGNVRELEGMVYDALAHHKSRMLSQDSFNRRIISGREQERVPESIERVSADLTRELVLPRIPDLAKEAVRRSGGNLSQAARMLGLTRQALVRYLNPS